MSEDKTPYVVSVHEPEDQRNHPIFRMFDRPIAFQRSFVTLTGSITAALMLSQAVYWSSRASNPAGWFYKSADEWEQETGMTRHEQEGARKRLRQFPWWQEDLRKANGVPTVHYRIDAVGFAQTVQMDFAKSAKPISRKVENGFAEIREIDMPKSAKSLTETTQKTTTTGGDGWAAVVDTYHQEIGVITPTVGEEIKAYYDEMGPTLLIDAFKEASRNNIRKWSYVDGILKKWRTNGRQLPNKDSGGNAWEQLNNGLPDYMKDDQP